MSGKKKKFLGQKNQKKWLLQKNWLFHIDDIDVNKTLGSKKEPYGINKSFKYFIGYNDDDVIRPLCLKLSKMTGYAKKTDKYTRMSLRINNKQPFKNYNKIWEKVEDLMKIRFESKCFNGNNDDKYIKTKIKIYEKNIITNFHNKKEPNEKVPCKCLSIIMLDSVDKSNEKYYPQTFLDECKNLQEKIKFENYINEELDSSANDETKSDIDNDE